LISRQSLFVGLGFLIACVVFSAGFKADPARSVPAAEPVGISAIKDDTKAKTPAEPAASDSVAELAAAQNGSLKTDLNWSFGGKAQRGWQLYLPLISEMIGADAEADGGDFALSLSRWQKASGLSPHGTLDGDTWSRMVSTWQSRRIKDRSSPSPEQLVTAPATDFYDVSRPAELRQVEKEAYAAYKRMVAAAAADPSLGLAAGSDGELAPSEKYLKIVSAFRSREYQAQLRRQSPHSGRAGLAVHSPHFTGRALDLYVGGEPVSTRDSNRALQTRTRAYQWLVKHAAEFGFRPYFYEPWHWEYCP
jgi:hypothetical protein